MFALLKKLSSRAIPPEILPADCVLIDQFAYLTLDWELGILEVSMLLGVDTAEAALCRSLNAKQRSPTVDERERMRMLCLIDQRLIAYFNQRKNDLSVSVERRRYWAAMDTRRFLREHPVLPHERSMWDLLEGGRFPDMVYVARLVSIITGNAHS